MSDSFPARTLQTAFTAGELDASMAARVDTTKYYAGAQQLLNVLVRPQGGIRRRPGMRHLLELVGGFDGCRLVPFAFNVEQTYCLVLVSGGFHVFLADATYAGFQGGAPWAGWQAARMKFAQSADTLLLFHPDMRPQKITRGATHTSWTRTDLALTNIPGHDFGAITPSGTMTPSATSGSVTITASVATFTAAHVGWQLTGNGGRARIDSVASGTSATATTLAPFKNTNAIAQADWQLLEPVISDTRGWPECGTFHEGRLWLAGLRSRPATLLGSKVASYFDFSGGTGLDDEALNLTIDSDQVNAIHAIRSGRSLQIFTAGAEFAVTVDPPITPRNVNLQEQTRQGISRYVPTVEVEGAVLFVQSGGKALRQFLYESVEDAYRSDLISLLSPHLIRAPVDMAVRKGSSQDDANLVFIVNTDGLVSVLTVLRAQEVVAFTRWETNGIIRNVAALASGEVFFIVQRGPTLRVEMLDEARLLDSGTLVTGAGITSVAGMSHMIGRMVRLLLDGADLGTAIVDPWGAVALPRAADKVEVGLDVPVRVVPMFFEPRNPTGALIGRKCRVKKATCRVRNTGMFRIRDTAVQLRTVGSSPAPPLGSAPPVLSGDVTVRGLVGWAERHSLVITQDVAAPFELLALSVELGFPA